MAYLAWEESTVTEVEHGGGDNGEIIVGSMGPNGLFGLQGVVDDDPAPKQDDTAVACAAGPAMLVLGLLGLNWRRRLCAR